MNQTIPFGMTQRRQWMEAFSRYKDAFQSAQDTFHEANSAMSAHPSDGMPKGSAKSDPVARRAENYEKAYIKLVAARTALDKARADRVTAMQPLDSDQQIVLCALYFEGASRRELAASLHRSDFWVRAQERTGLFLLELPAGWEQDILP